MSAIVAYPRELDTVEHWRQGWPIAFDFETWLIEPGRQLPPAVCMSFAMIVPNAAAVYGMSVGSSGVVTAREGIALLLHWLENGATLVGANTAFDALVSVVSSPDWKRQLRAFVQAYEAGRVRDVLVRQKLLDLAAGTFGWEPAEEEGGKPRHHRYNLADVSRRLTKRRLSKPEGDDEEHWRLRFGELDGLPVAQYPQEAYDYALEDAVATAEDFIVQEHLRTNHPIIQRNFPGKDPLADEIRQTMACVPLRSMSAYGLRTDKAAVERFAVEVQEKIVEVRADLVEAGLVRKPSFSRNTDKIVEWIKTSGRLAHFVEGDQIKLSKARYLAAWEATKDVQFWRLAYYLDISKAPDKFSADIDALFEAGLIDVEHSRDTKAAALRCARAYQRQGLPIPRTDGYSPKPVEKGGKGHGELDCVSLDADACDGADDPLLELYSAYTSLAKTLSSDIPMLLAGVTMPVHSRFEELKETGRTGSSKPNVQNVRRLPGIRECFRPRDGFVFIDTDFSMLELHTLAQVCFWALGFSTLGEALNSGQDPHLKMASVILAIDYAVALQRKEQDDSEVGNARTAGKGVNFGAPGGLSAKTFVVYAWANYKIRLTLEQAENLIKLYHSTWREIPTYFRWVKGHKDPYSVRTYIDEETGQERETCTYNIVQHWSGRLRAGVGYCAACNSPFQGLGADVAKVALWLVWKATMGLSELGEADPLYGCFIVNFVHDSIMTEAPEHRAHEAAMRQKELMEQAGRMVLPDCPAKADMVVTRQWSKKSGQWREPCAACGSPQKCRCEGVKPWKERRLIPWDLRIAARRALDEFAKKPIDKQVEIVAQLVEGKDKWKELDGTERAKRCLAAVEKAGDQYGLGVLYLKKKEWPTDVARDVSAEVFGSATAQERIAA